MTLEYEDEPVKDAGLLPTRDPLRGFSAPSDNPPTLDAYGRVRVVSVRGEQELDEMERLSLEEAERATPRAVRKHLAIGVFTLAVVGGALEAIHLFASLSLLELYMALFFLAIGEGIVAYKVACDRDASPIAVQFAKRQMHAQRREESHDDIRTLTTVGGVYEEFDVKRRVAEAMGGSGGAGFHAQRTFAEEWAKEFAREALASRSKNSGFNEE